MPTNLELEALALKVEQASGPNFELEQEIGRAVSHPLADIPTRCPAYTASIDAAMTLKPSNLYITMGDDPSPWANLWRRWPENGHVARGVGETLALAICCAALRARSLTKESSDHG